MTPDFANMSAADLTDALIDTMSAAGGITFRETMIVLAGTEGASEDEYVTWLTGFMACLDYVLADPELAMQVAEWYHAVLADAGLPDEVAWMGERSTQAGLAVFRAALRNRAPVVEG